MDVTTHPFPYCNGGLTAEVRARIIKYAPILSIDVITYPCPNSEVGLANLCFMKKTLGIIRAFHAVLCFVYDWQLTYFNHIPQGHFIFCHSRMSQLAPVPGGNP